jgi:DNA-binding MarR family transcriptional regulator
VTERAAAPQSEIDEVRQTVAAFVAAGADESVQRVITAVHRLSRRLNRWYDHQLADLGMTSGEWAVLDQLVRSPGGAPLTPSQLALATHVAPSSMTHRLDRMVERGLISRAADPDNRTRVLVQLTDAGYGLYAQAIRKANVVEADLLAALSPEQQEQLADLLELVIACVDEVELEQGRRGPVDV